METKRVFLHSVFATAAWRQRPFQLQWPDPALQKVQQGLSIQECGQSSGLGGAEDISSSRGGGLLDGELDWRAQSCRVVASEANWRSKSAADGKWGKELSREANFHSKVGLCRVELRKPRLQEASSNTLSPCTSHPGQLHQNALITCNAVGGADNDPNPYQSHQLIWLCRLIESSAGCQRFKN